MLRILSKSNVGCLREVVLPYRETTQWYTRAQIVARVLPLLRQLKVLRKMAGGEGGAEVEKVVRFVDCSDTGVLGSAVDTYTDDLREELRWELKW